MKPAIVFGWLFVLATGPEALAGPTEDGWLEALYESVAADLTAGKPMVVHAHVPLCSNEIIWCGNARLGDGDNPRTNLYWATSGGFRGWFKRKGSGWKRVYKGQHSDNDILEVMVWKRRASPSRALRERGVTERFDLYVVAYAWRGSAINRAMEAYSTDLFGDRPRAISLPNDVELQAGGAAHVVAYVGHNGWMDVDSYDWARFDKLHRDTTKPKGTIAVACITADYIAGEVSARSRVPLLMTTSLMFAGAHSFEGAVRGFARGESLGGIRKSAVSAYARGQGKPAQRVRVVFTNPSDKRWKRRIGVNNDPSRPGE